MEREHGDDDSMWYPSVIFVHTILHYPGVSDSGSILWPITEEEEDGPKEESQSCKNMPQRTRVQEEAGMAGLVAITGLQSKLSSLLAFWLYLIYKRKSNSIIVFVYVYVYVRVYSLCLQLTCLPAIQAW